MGWRIFFRSSVDVLPLSWSVLLVAWRVSYDRVNLLGCLFPKVRQLQERRGSGTLMLVGDEDDMSFLAQASLLSLEIETNWCYTGDLGRVSAILGTFGGVAPIGEAGWYRWIYSCFNEIAIQLVVRCSSYVKGTLFYTHQAVCIKQQPLCFLIEDVFDVLPPRTVWKVNTCMVTVYPDSCYG